MTTNRIVALAAAALSLLVAVLPAVANLDWTSTAGVIAGIVSVAGLALKWLDGWQKHEAEVANAERERAWQEREQLESAGQDQPKVVGDPVSGLISDPDLLP